jgi:hypothetical protein
VSGPLTAAGFTHKPKESRPPTYAGLDAFARGLADHATRDADALLLWYRTAGQENRRHVELYLARRAIAAKWDCTTQQAAAVIADAMTHVALRRPNGAGRAAYSVGMRKANFLELRALASAWLRAGVMDAVWRYGLATL